MMEVSEKAGPKGETEGSTSQVGVMSHDGNDTRSGSEVEAEVEDESQYPGGFTVALILFGMCLASFAVALDNTIIATAIPRITEDFDSLGDVGWYGSVYLLTTTAIQPSFGRVYNMFNVKYTYIVAIIIFEVGSIICAAATSSPMFIVGRAIAGIGGAGGFAGAVNIMVLIAPLRKRSVYNPILTSMFGIASVVGPLLGGAFTDRLTWRWCFWINLPFGGVAIAVVLLLFKMPQSTRKPMTLSEKVKNLDLLGGLFFIGAIACLLLALHWGGQEYPWSDSKVVGCFVGAGLLLIAFTIEQIRRPEKATIPGRVIKQRTVWSSLIFLGFLSMGIYVHFYYLPFFFQFVRGTSAVTSGIDTVPYIVSITVAAVVIGGGVTSVGYYAPFLWVGSALFTIGSGLIYTYRPDISTGKWIGYQILAGIGAGAGLQIPFISVQNVLPPEDIATGNALAGFFNFLGAGLSISIAQNIFGGELAAQQAAGVDRPEAYNDAVTKAFILSIATGGLAFIFSLFVELKSIKGKKIDMTAAG